MFNPRIMVAGAVAFIIILICMSWVTDKGLDKAMPMMEKQKQKAEQLHAQQQKMIQENLAGMGATQELINSAANTPPSDMEMNGGVITSPTPRRPVGTWTGIVQGDQTKMAFMKFDKKHYWLMVKGAPGQDYTEKGDYSFEFDHLMFEPENGEQYSMEYFMPTLKSIELYKYGSSYTFSKTDDLDLDF